MNKSVNSFCIAHLTDLHLLAKPEDQVQGVNTAHSFQKILEKLLATYSVDLILLTGDISESGCDTSYQYLASYLLDLKIDCVCLPGNHDNFSLMEKILINQYVSCEKQIILDNWQVICLNSQIPNENGGRLAEKELLFLQHCLNEYPNHHALIALHHHCLPTYSTWMDTMIVENSLEFFSLISQYDQTKVIVNGHIHQSMDVVAHEKFRVLATPSTCYQFTSFSPTFGIDSITPAGRIIYLQEDGNIFTEVIELKEYP